MGILLVYDVTDERSFNSKPTYPRASLTPPHPALQKPPQRDGDGGLLTLRPHLRCFPDIRTWFSNVEQHATEGVNKILIGNKCDWEEKRVVSRERGQALADELAVPFLEVSAKSNINVEKAFYSLAADIKKRIIDTSKSDQGASQGVNVADQRDSVGGGLGGKCC